MPGRTLEYCGADNHRIKATEYEQKTTTGELVGLDSRGVSEGAPCLLEPDAYAVVRCPKEGFLRSLKQNLQSLAKQEGMRA